MRNELEKVGSFVNGVVSRRQREIRRLRRSPTNQPGKTWLIEPEFEFVDGLTFAGTYEHIFQQHIYDFLPRNEMPIIIDGGANIGMSVVYFKQQFPQARIIAFEPDGSLFEILERNVAKCTDGEGIELIRAAVWDSNRDEIPFMIEGNLSGRATSIDPALNQTTVPSIDLCDFLSEPVGLLKLDIEGAELTVLKRCEEKLQNVDFMFVEYHSFENQPQELSQLLKIIQDAGFRYWIGSEFLKDRPLVNHDVQIGMDLQLNIFAFRSQRNEPDANAH